MGDLTEEELARLDRVVATWADLGTDGVSLPWREFEAVLVALPALLASARVVRKVETVLERLRDESVAFAVMHQTQGSNAYGNAARWLAEALAAEPTAKEDDNAAK